MFRNYEEFFAFYLEQHSRPATRWIHFAGTVTGLVILVTSVVTGFYWGILGAFVTGYAFAWFSHFFIEHNRPATFGHPFWSFISDFRMAFGLLTGRYR